MRASSLMLLAATALGCAASVPSLPPGTVFLTQTQLAGLRAAAAEVTALRGENAALKQRLSVLEQRVGLARFTPKKLKRIDGVSVQVKPGVYVADTDARATRRKLDKHVAGFEGGYVVAFWATWCKPCTSREELARLRELKGRLSRSNVALVSILIDDLGKARADPRAPGWLYPFWFREDAHLDMLPRSFIERVGLNLPLFLVVSPTGAVRWFYNSALTDESMREIVTATARVCRG